MRSAGRGQLLAVLLALALVTAGCTAGGGAREPAGGGSLAVEFDLSGTEVVVGSKETTEQLVLGELTIAALQAAGASISDQTGLAGTAAARSALEAGEIDLYWEYTGTGWIAVLGETDPITDPTELYEEVADRDLAENEVVWLPPAPLDNTFGVAQNPQVAQQFGVQTLSDLAELTRSHPEEVTVCADSEFRFRDDGLPGLEETYDFVVPPEQVDTVAIGVLYGAINQAEPCNFGAVAVTDGRIPAFELMVLQDDEEFFLAYNGSATIRQDALDASPQIADVLAELSPLLTSEVMQELNRQVDVEGRDPAQVARRFLAAEGLID